MSNRLIGYQPGRGFLYDLSGASKMLFFILVSVCLLYTSPSPRDRSVSRMPSSA